MTLKDQQQNFLNNPKMRLLNLPKHELSRISKVILDKINLNLRNTTKVNQRKTSKDVISWFNNLRTSKNVSLFLFDSKDFYPTITKELLSKCLSFAETKLQISEENDDEIIYHSRKSVLFVKGKAWMKKRREL